MAETYDFDAFGNLINHTGTTPNNYLYAGEQWDPDLGLYYNRARYLNVGTGRFWNMDSFQGINEDPLSLHKYLYARLNPINNIDPSGLFTEITATTAIQAPLRVNTTFSATTIYLSLGETLAIAGITVGFFISASVNIFRPNACNYYNNGGLPTLSNDKIEEILKKHGDGEPRYPVNPLYTSQFAKPYRDIPGIKTLFGLATIVSSFVTLKWRPTQDINGRPGCLLKSRHPFAIVGTFNYLKGGSRDFEDTYFYSIIAPDKPRGGEVSTMYPSDPKDPTR